jgi:dihydrolipoamide dehydrogenase
LKSAQVFEYIQHAEDYGINVDKASANFEGMIKRSRGVADGMSKGINFLFRKNKITVIDGNGKLARGKKVEVTDAAGKTKEYSADCYKYCTYYTHTFASIYLATITVSRNAKTP